MGSTISSYEIARSGLFVSERALSVTGHNVANVNTPGYVRQQVMINGAQNHRLWNGMQIGLGADIQHIRQIRHAFMDIVFRKESSVLGYWEAISKTLSDIEAILAEPMGNGLQTVMNQFWDSWQELSKNPESLTVRALVRQRGEALVRYANHIGKQIDKLQEDLNDEVKVRIEEVNDICKDIARLNKEIARVEGTLDTANDFRDQRNLLLDRLSKLVNIEVVEMQDGQISVYVGDQCLVNRGESVEIYAGKSQESGTFFIPKIVGNNIEIKLTSGTIKGLMESRGEVYAVPGSLENGTPNNKADIVFAIDISNGSSGYLINIKSQISSYIDELKKTGIDYNLKLITFKNGVAHSSAFTSDDSEFMDEVDALTEDSFDSSNNFEALVDELCIMSDFRKDANRYAVVFTGESIGGNETAVADNDINDMVDALTDKGIKVSIATDSSYFQSGFPAVETSGWDKIASGTGGKLYDLNSGDFASLMREMAFDTKNDINFSISSFEKTTGILPDLKKRLNALINVIAREVNYLHRSGKVLGSTSSVPDGQDFFVASNNAGPIELGNIKLNDNLVDLNNIVASTTGASGDNTIALSIANLRNKPLLKDEKGVVSMDDYYQSIILAVGNDSATAKNTYNSQLVLVNSTDDYRQSITGVSMDEEMTNMMKYKFAYNASSRVINVIDEMVRNVIERMGLVGR